MSGRDLGDADLWGLAQAFGLLSLVAIGGANAVTPEVRRLAVDAHPWLTPAQFAEAFAIAQAAPGPNVMLASLIGWRVAGLAGLVTATLAMNTPSALLAFAVGRGWRRWAGSPWIGRLERVLAPVAAGLICAGGLVLVRTADHTAQALALSTGVAAFAVLSRRNPLWALAAAAALGVLLHRLGHPV